MKWSDIYRYSVRERGSRRRPIVQSYLEARRALIDLIKSRSFAIGDKLPTEGELVEALGVSRLTLREALRMLREEGLIYIQQGSGMYVSGDVDQVTRTFNTNLGITEMIQAAGYAPGVKSFYRGLEKADAEIAAELRIPELSDVVVVRRIRTADDRPVVFSADYIAPRIAADFLAKNDENLSLYAFIEGELKIKIGIRYTEILAERCSAELASAFGYEEGAPILLMKGLIADQKGDPLIYGRDYFRPGVLKISITRRRF